MNIAIPVFSLDRAGGTQRYTWEVARGLAARGHAVTMYAPADGNRPPGTSLEPVGRGRTPTSWQGGVSMVTFGALASARIMMRDRSARRYGPLGYLLAPGVVTIHSVHRASVEDRVRNLGGRGPSAFDQVWIALERVTYAIRGMRFLAVSPACASAVSAAFDVDPARIGLAPPAVGPEMTPPSEQDRERARAALGLDVDDYAVGTVANYNFESKGVPDLMVACAEIGARLLVAGVDDLRRPELERLATRLSARVSFLGRVEDIVGFYHGLDAFALVSQMESYGMAAHEAMACGAAVVVTETCGITGLLTPGRDALVVERGSPVTIGAALERLREPASRAALADAGGAWARGRTWDLVTDEVAAALEG